MFLCCVSSSIITDINNSAYAIRVNVSLPLNLMDIRTKGRLGSGIWDSGVCVYLRKRKKERKKNTIAHNTMCDSHCHTQHRTGMRVLSEDEVKRERKHTLS